MKHFTFAERTTSAKARQLGLDNMPKSIEIIDNIARLWGTVLDPLREAMGFPVIISSGYRCNELNSAVGGAFHSRHLLGLAADIDCGTEKNLRIYYWLQERRHRLKELLFEGDGRWVHVAL